MSKSGICIKIKVFLYLGINGINVFGMRQPGIVSLLS